MAKYHDHYERVTWTNGVTSLSAEHMNNLEDGINDLIEYKVEKEEGKGLSTNDFTTAEKNKLSKYSQSPSFNFDTTNSTETFSITSPLYYEGSKVVTNEGYYPLVVCDFEVQCTDFPHLTKLKITSSSSGSCTVSYRVSCEQASQDITLKFTVLWVEI